MAMYCSSFKGASSLLVRIIVGVHLTMLYLRYLSQDYLLVFEGHVILGAHTSNDTWSRTHMFILALLSITVTEALAILDLFERMGTTSAHSYLGGTLRAYHAGSFLSLCSSLGLFGYYMMFGDGDYQSTWFGILLATNIPISLVMGKAMLSLGGLSALVKEARALWRTFQFFWTAEWNILVRNGMA